VLAADAQLAGLREQGPGEMIPLQAQRQGPGRLRLTGDLRAGLAVVAESYNAGWRATADGRAVPVLPVNHLMLGVAVPAGASRVDLEYAPASVRAGLFLGLLALALLAGTGGATVLRPRKRQRAGIRM
jgi:hypothetical protein